jgi:ABC-type nitrate/sulfonate/bicarbonate transport system substrate-binding protein
MRRLPIVLVVLAMFIAACTADSSESPSSSVASDAPSAPSDDGSPSAEPPAESTEPERSGSARIGSGGDISMATLPTLIVIDRMNELGYDVEMVQFGGSTSEVQAAVDGAIDISSASAPAQMAAMDAGLPNRFFLSRVINEFVLVARAEFDTCESLDGQPVAVHGLTSTDGLMTVNWLEENCPDAEPTVQIVEGSENRLVALLQDQVAASPLDLQNTVGLQAERPGDFEILGDYIADFPIYAGTFSASPEWMAANEQLVADFISLHLDVWEEIYEDSSILLERAEAELGQVDPELLPDIVQAYVDAEVFPRDGGLTEDAVLLTLEFSDQAADFQAIESYEDVATREYLDAALAAR